MYSGFHPFQDGGARPPEMGFGEFLRWNISSAKHCLAVNLKLNPRRLMSVLQSGSFGRPFLN